MHHDGEDFFITKTMKRIYVTVTNEREFFWVLTLETKDRETFYLFLMPNGDRVLTQDLNYPTYMDARMLKGISSNV